jgi:long-chain fatty acid transport protein
VAPTTPPSTLFYDIPGGNYTPGDYMRAVAGTLGLPPEKIALLNGTAAMLDYSTAVEADVEEKGNGITPILGASLTFGERFNIGLKYEFKTTIDLKQTIIDGKDANGMFVQDSTVHSDMPAMISVGVGYKILPKLSAQAGVHYYFDKDVNYGKTLDLTGEQVTNDKVIDKNYLEAAIGFEYNITDNFLLSTGYLLARTGVTADYQSDLSYSLSSNTFAVGAAYDVNSWIRINIGASYSIYDEGTKTINTGLSTATLNFYKDTFLAGIGVDINL